MYPMHPELRKGLAEARIRRLAEDMQASSPVGIRRWLADLRRRPGQASSASLTSLSASSLCSRRTAV